MQRQRGFTLLELMLVLFIIGISASVIMLAYGQVDNEEKTAGALADRLNSMIAFSVDKAAIEGNPLGILFSADGWQILQPAHDKHDTWSWEPLTSDTRLALSGQWGSALQINLAHFPETENTPQVFILPDGQISTFSLTFRSRETQQPLFNLRSDGAFPLHLQPIRENRR